MANYLEVVGPLRRMVIVDNPVPVVRCAVGAGNDSHGSPPPTIGKEEFGPGEVNDTAQIAINLTGFLIPILAEIIDADFSPASGIKAANNALKSLRAIRRGEGPNEYGLLAEGIGTAVQRAPFGYREADLKRAAALAIENLRLMLGKTEEAPRDMSAKTYLQLRGQTRENIFRRFKSVPKRPPELTERKRFSIPVRNGPKGHNGKVTPRYAVRRGMGLSTEEFSMYEVERAEVTGNADRNPMIEAVKLAGGSSVWVTPDGRQWTTFQRAEEWLEKFQAKESRVP